MAQKKLKKNLKKKPVAVSKSPAKPAAKKKAASSHPKAHRPVKKTPVRAKKAPARKSVDEVLFSTAALRAQMKKLISAKNPADYIEKSLSVKLSVPQKGYITRLWLDKTGYTVKDIEYARNRNPYWKKMKSEGSLERNEKRFKMHDYRDKKHKKTSAPVEWNDANIKTFLEMTGKMTDWQLAEHFSTTIPAINHLRRKYNTATRLVTALGKAANAKTLIPIMRSSEGVIKRQLAQAVAFKKRR